MTNRVRDKLLIVITVANCVGIYVNWKQKRALGTERRLLEDAYATLALRQAELDEVVFDINAANVLVKKCIAENQPDFALKREAERLRKEIDEAAAARTP